MRYAGILLWLLCITTVACADDWPQWLGPKRDSVWREEGIIDKFPEGGPKIRWRVPVGAGYSGPAVAGGRVFVHDRILKTGTTNPSNPFARGTIAGDERVLCLNEADGKLLWEHGYPCSYSISYAAGPRATPIVDADKVYTWGAEGDLHCLEAATGKTIWAFKAGSDGTPTPMWGFSASPMIDGDRLICITGGKDALVTAFNKNNGQVIWKALNAKEPGYCAPTIIEAGGKRQLIVWDPEALVSLNPETGEKYWSEPMPVKMGLTTTMPRMADGLLFASAFYDGALMMKLDADKPAATKLWKRAGKNERNTDALQTILSTPIMKDGYIYGVCAYGQLRCIRADTGDRLWETFAATSGDDGSVRWSNAFITPIGDKGDRYFLANEHGDLILANMTPKGYEELGRAHLLEPTNRDAGRLVVWSQPAYANKSIYWRNDKELVCAWLGKD